MKKSAAIVILVLAVWACHRKTVPPSEIVISNKVKTEDTKTKTETTVPVTNTSTDIVATGKIVFTTRCNKCHALKTVENYTALQWENILKSMIPKARLNEDESKQVTAYVMANAKKQ